MTKETLEVLEYFNYDLKSLLEGYLRLRDELRAEQIVGEALESERKELQTKLEKYENLPKF